MGKEHSRQREEPVQRPWGRNKLGVFKGQQGGQVEELSGRHEAGAVTRAVTTARRWMEGNGEGWGGAAGGRCAWVKVMEEDSARLQVWAARRRGVPRGP